MGRDKLLTIEMVRDKFPAEARPSARLVRETAQRLGLGRRWGRAYYLTEAEADALLLAGSVREPFTAERIARSPKQPRHGSNVERALQLSKRLKQLGLK
jgi:hypothetical protein